MVLDLRERVETPRRGVSLGGDVAAGQRPAMVSSMICFGAGMSRRASRSCWGLDSSVRWRNVPGGSGEGTGVEPVEVMADVVPGLAGRGLDDPDQEQREPAEQQTSRITRNAGRSTLWKVDRGHRTSVPSGQSVWSPGYFCGSGGTAGIAPSCRVAVSLIVAAAFSAASCRDDGSRPTVRRRRP